MEFYRIIKVKTTEKSIQNKLTIANLESISNELFVIGDQNTTEAEIGSIWGEFTLTRSLIRGGMRFALEECPNALAWTITTGIEPHPDLIVIHLTINRKEQTADFIKEIEAFLNDQCSCLEQYLKKNI